MTGGTGWLSALAQRMIDSRLTRKFRGGTAIPRIGRVKNEVSWMH
jgi:hypothetical protein